LSAGFHWEVETPELSEDAARAALEAALALGGRPGARLDVVFATERTLRGLHERFLGDPSPTDVLAFDLGAGEEGPEGEVYVGVECARRTAGQRGVAVARELCLYLVHGVLHLCGFDDGAEPERATMRAAERRVLDGLGYAPDDGPHDVHD